MNPESEVVIPQIKVGDTAPNFTVALARMNPQLQSLFFTIYFPLPGAHERVGEFHNKPATEIVRNFLHHDHRTNEHWQVSASDVTNENISERLANLPRNLGLGLESKCIFRDASVRYIPMMDFKLSHSRTNLELLKEFLGRLAYKGIIVDSGASYHFYGFDFLDHSHWVRFMAECLLIPWSDSRWIGHSLIDGSGDLRISSTELKPKLPRVCEVLK
jgi:hypothetical protein